MDEPQTAPPPSCSCRDPHCPYCNPAGIVRLEASSRTRNRFLAGVVIGSMLNFLIPVLVPFSIIGSLGASLYLRLLPAPRMLAGVAALATFWIWLLPGLGKPQGGEIIVIGAFLALIYLYLARPGRLCARELLFRGRGLLGGLVMSSTLVAAVLSLAAPIGAAFFS